MLSVMWSRSLGYILVVVCVSFVKCASIGWSHVSECIDVYAKMFFVVEGLWGFLVNLICGVIVFESGYSGYLCILWCHMVVGPCCTVEVFGYCCWWYIDKAYGAFGCFSS